MSSGVGPRRSLDLALLWLWRRLAATALIRPLAWEPPCETGAALKRQKTKKKKRKRKLPVLLKATSKACAMYVQCVPCVSMSHRSGKIQCGEDHTGHTFQEVLFIGPSLEARYLSAIKE